MTLVYDDDRNGIDFAELLWLRLVKQIQFRKQYDKHRALSSCESSTSAGGHAEELGGNILWSFLNSGKSSCDDSGISSSFASHPRPSAAGSGPEQYVTLDLETINSSHVPEVLLTSRVKIT